MHAHIKATYSRILAWKGSLDAGMAFIVRIRRIAVFCLIMGLFGITASGFALFLNRLSLIAGIFLVLILLLMAGIGLIMTVFTTKILAMHTALIAGNTTIKGVVDGFNTAQNTIDWVRRGHDLTKRTQPRQTEDTPN